MSEPQFDRVKWLEQRRQICDAAVKDAIAGAAWREKHYERMKQYNIEPEEIMRHLEQEKSYSGILGKLRRKIKEIIHELIGHVEDRSEQSASDNPEKLGSDRDTQEALRQELADLKKNMGPGQPPRLLLSDEPDQDSWNQPSRVPKRPLLPLSEGQIALPVSKPDEDELFSKITHLGKVAPFRRARHTKSLLPKASSNWRKNLSKNSTNQFR